MTALLIRGARVIDPAARLDAVLDVRFADGFVAEIAPGLDPANARVIDGRGCVLAPGFVDLHAHLREPGFEQKGTIATETLAALRGGFTTVCAMPNTEPAPDSAPVVESLLGRISRDARVRVFPIGAVTRRRAGQELSEIAEMAAAGVVAISDDGSPVADAGLFRRALEYATAAGIPLSDHADDPILNAGGVMHEGRVSERLGLKGQPAAAEVTAIARNIALAEATGGRLHIAHISTARGVEMVADARARGVAVTCEVTPSHLFLTEDAIAGSGPEPAYDTAAKVNPPLRTAADRAALVRGLAEGVIDAIATDHAPHAAEDKLCEFDLASPGISCFETALGTLLLQAERGELPLPRIIEALTFGPVACFGLDRRVPGLGRLQRGVSRDLVLFDPGDRWVVDTAAFVSKGKNSPLQGAELRGGLRLVVVDGRVAYEREGASV